MMNITKSLFLKLCRFLSLLSVVSLLSITSGCNDEPSNLLKKDTPPPKKVAPLEEKSTTSKECTGQEDKAGDAKNTDCNKSVPK